MLLSVNCILPAGYLIPRKAEKRIALLITNSRNRFTTNILFIPSMEKESVELMWNEFLAANPAYAGRYYASWYFCDTKECADEFADLVKKGIKRGTASLYYWYESGKEKLPLPGELSIVTDWEGEACCIILSRKITILPFCNVTEEMAAIEGEGDKSLQYWRNAHISFFSRDLKNTDMQFDENMLIVFEEFDKIYP